MKFFTLISFSLFFFQISFALSFLPPNAFLQPGDHSYSVKILQEILNSDPDTQITDFGPGSPGKETWYFGESTEEALKVFQSKNYLKPTGRIDYLTYESLNKYVKNYQTSLGSVTSKNLNKETNDQIDRVNDSIQEENKKDFEIAKKSQNKTTQIKPEKNLDEKEKSKKLLFLDLFSAGDIFENNLNKKGWFDDEQTKNQNIPKNSNIQNLFQDYSKSYPNSNFDTSMPPTKSRQPPTNFGSTVNPFFRNQAKQHMENSPSEKKTHERSLVDRIRDRFTNIDQKDTKNLAVNKSIDWGLCDALPVGEKPPSAVLSGGGEGGGCGKGSIFGHNKDGSSDPSDNGLGCTQGNGKRYDTRTEEGIALPVWLQEQMFGKDGPGKAPAVGCGGWVEVTDPKTKKCFKFKIVDSGPAKWTKRIIDFTGTACNRIGCVTDQIYCFRKASNQSPSKKN